MASPETDTAADRSVDVVVVGSGAAGLFAAVEAADAGARVVVVEREPQTGGSTRLSGGYVALCETELEPGSRAELLEDLLESHHDDCDESLSELYVELAPGTFTRLKELGIEFQRTVQFAHMRRPWGHELPTGGELTGGAQVVEALETQARARGVEILLSTPARRLVEDADGRVVGVEIEGPDGPARVIGGRGVVIATGGFTRNPELIRKYGRPGTEHIVPVTGPGSLGEGLVMSQALGADTSYIGVGVAPTAPVEPTTGEGNIVVYAGGILLNRDGRRFHDESAVYLDFSFAGLRQPGGLMIQVYDSLIWENYGETMIGQALTGGRTFAAEDLRTLLEDVSAECGLDVDAALQTIQDYNRFVEEGFDPEFGREHIVGSAGDLVTISHPPYHAAITVPGTTHFNGGLRIDTEMRVLDVFGDVIPGLFAAGEVTGGFHGAGYLSASFMGMALIFGRVAGMRAAAVHR